MMESGIANFPLSSFCIKTAFKFAVNYYDSMTPKQRELVVNLKTDLSTSGNSRQNLLRIAGIEISESNLNTVNLILEAEETLASEVFANLDLMQDTLYFEDASDGYKQVFRTFGEYDNQIRSLTLLADIIISSEPATLLGQQSRYPDTEMKFWSNLFQRLDFMVQQIGVGWCHLKMEELLPGFSKEEMLRKLRTKHAGLCYAMFMLEEYDLDENVRDALATELLANALKVWLGDIDSHVGVFPIPEWGRGRWFDGKEIQFPFPWVGKVPFDCPGGYLEVELDDHVAEPPAFGFLHGDNLGNPKLLLLA